MQDQHKTDQDIVDELNNKSLDEIIEDNDSYDKQYQHAEIEHTKTRTPLYVIVGAAFLIATVNSIYIHSTTILVMCLLFGGGSLIYLYATRHNAADHRKSEVGTLSGKDEDHAQR